MKSPSETSLIFLCTVCPKSPCTLFVDATEPIQAPTACPFKKPEDLDLLNPIWLIVPSDSEDESEDESEESEPSS